jgi:hypothetical protein
VEERSPRGGISGTKVPRDMRDLDIPGFEFPNKHSSVTALFATNWQRQQKKSCPAVPQGEKTEKQEKRDGGHRRKIFIF